MKIFSCDGSKFIKTVRNEKSIKQVCQNQHPPVVFCKKDDNDCFYAKILRDYSKEREIVEILRQNVLPPQHVIEFLPCEETTTEIAFTKAVEPFFGSVKTVKDMLNCVSNMPISICQSVLAQIICLFILGQEKDPQFAHNDLKADNVLITKETSSEPLQIGKYSIRHYGIRVVIIDCETVTGSLFPTLSLKEIPEPVQYEFGLHPSMPYSTWTDLHLMLMEFWIKIKNSNCTWKNTFYLFLKACMFPKFFTTYAEGNMLVSKYNRLNSKGRLALNYLMDKKEVKSIQEIIHLSFFESVVTENKD